MAFGCIKIVVVFGLYQNHSLSLPEQQVQTTVFFAPSSFTYTAIIYITQTAPSWLDSSVGRALHRYRRGNGLNSVLNFLHALFQELIQWVVYISVISHHSCCQPFTKRILTRKTLTRKSVRDHYLAPSSITSPRLWTVRPPRTIGNMGLPGRGEKQRKETLSRVPITQFISF